MPPLSPRPTQWRGRLEDAELMAREFPALASALARPETRRRVLRLMAASAALGGLSGCGDPSTPDGSYTPAVNQAANIIPGKPNHYATALLDGGTATGIVVRQDMGRPVKIEGNSVHSASLGATSIHGQALLLDFYDPDRAAGVLTKGDIATWQALQRAMGTQRAELAATRGAGLRILTGRVMSPTLGAAIAGLLRHYPQARWHQWEALSRDAVRQGAVLAYGRPVDMLPHADRADVVLALDSDLISQAPGHLRHARDIAGRRNPTRGAMSRLYAAEPVPSLIGGIADHRFIAHPADMPHVVNALAAAILGDGASADAPPWVAAAARDLQRAGAHALVHAGPDMPTEAHALVHRINEKLGARGTTFDLIDPAAIRPDDEAGGMATLIADMQAGQVRSLLILDTNPAYTAPDFADALRRVPFSLAANAAPDETARAATWFAPLAHLFEAWGDARAHDGTVTIQQPQSLPLHGGRSAFDMLALFTGEPPVGSEDTLRAAWRDRLDDGAWQDALAAGVVAGTASPPANVKLVAGAPAMVQAPPPAAMTLMLRPDPNLLDGRWANNPWLQELPRPLGKIVWDNPLLLAPATALRLNVTNGDELRLTVAGRSMTAPVWVLPGQAENTVLGWLGGGRRAAGDVGNFVGANVYPLRRQTGAVTLEKTGRTIRVASTDHHNMLDVEPKMVDAIVRHGTLAEFAANAHVTAGEQAEPVMYRPPADRVAWGMSIDLNACIGCNACVTACQAENNVPVVGREQVLIGREMHWLRIDRYYEGAAEDPASFLQPVLCMHCEEAPCEPVCPVEASIHDSEGLNLQVYNRCIGTRFCSNNCPYKVRRFNFGAWAAEEHRTDISRNPDVSVRSRGVMEKCTFCVQRIAGARIAADKDGVAEEVVTACQAACPTQAFSFGNINDPRAEVVARKHSPLTYILLPEQNTRPRVTYEARITNRNPDLSA